MELEVKFSNWRKVKAKGLHQEILMRTKALKLRVGKRGRFF